MNNNLMPRGSSIILSNGRWCDPLNFRAQDIDIDQAFGVLSRIRRFNGQTNDPWSVGQHTLFVYEMMLSIDASLHDTLWALIHDIGEAYIGDLPRPIKREIPRFAEIEGAILETFARTYGLEPFMPALVELADDVAVSYEALQLLPSGPVSEWVMPTVPMSVARYMVEDFKRIEAMTDAQVLDELSSVFQVALDEWAGPDLGVVVPGLDTESYV